MIMTPGPVTVGDLIGGLRSGSIRKEDLREIVKRFKAEPDLIARAGRSIIKAIPDDPFDNRMDDVDDDYRLLKKALEEAGGGDVVEAIDRDVQKGLRRKATSWTIKELFRDGGPSQEQLDRIREAAASGDGEEKEFARQAIEELGARGIPV
jgi:hypothetical protein